MSAKQQPWLISFKYYAVFAKPDGRDDRHGPNETVLIIDQPPWKFLADTKADLRKVQNREGITFTSGDDRADDIVAVYWAVQIPIGVLTEDEVDSLS